MPKSQTTAKLRTLSRELWPATSVAFLAVPQGLAYATIAGLPPVVGLYASMIPPVVGGILRSSRHVVTGPTNALSLLVGAAVVSTHHGDPVQVALALAVMVGLIQIVAGLLRLGRVVGYVSTSVVLGYITGAALLIGAGQLSNLTGTDGVRGTLWTMARGWSAGLADTSGVSVLVGAATLVIFAGVRWINARTDKKYPGALIALGTMTFASWAMELEQRGLRVVSDISEISSGLPPFTRPSAELWPELLPLAVACAVLSLIESSSVARAIAGRTGDVIDSSREFFGQGMANLAAGLFSGYPVSGSLGRSALNEQAGAQTRWSSVMSGVVLFTLVVFAGGAINHTPIASLAGILFVIAFDLVDATRIHRAIRASWGDAVAFGVTLIGTCSIRLDLAIYLGISMSLILHLRRARMLVIRELVLTSEGRMHEGAPHDEAPTRPESTQAIVAADQQRCRKVRILHVEGALFFGSAPELGAALDKMSHEDDLVALVVRLKRTSGMDASCADELSATAARMRERGRHLVLAGLNREAYRVLERSGALESIGEENVFETQETWLMALDAARVHAMALAQGECATCPWRDGRSFLPPAVAVEENVPLSRSQHADRSR